MAVQENDRFWEGNNRSLRGLKSYEANGEQRSQFAPTTGAPGIKRYADYASSDIESDKSMDAVAESWYK